LVREPAKKRQARQAGEGDSLAGAAG
jgi:hypothetical protein